MPTLRAGPLRNRCAESPVILGLDLQQTEEHDVDIALYLQDFLFALFCMSGERGSIVESRASLPTRPSMTSMDLASASCWVLLRRRLARMCFARCLIVGLAWPSSGTNASWAVTSSSGARTDRNFQRILAAGIAHETAAARSKAWRSRESLANPTGHFASEGKARQARRGARGCAFHDHSPAPGRTAASQLFKKARHRVVRERAKVVSSVRSAAGRWRCVRTGPDLVLEPLQRDAPRCQREAADEHSLQHAWESNDSSGPPLLLRLTADSSVIDSGDSNERTYAIEDRHGGNRNDVHCRGRG